MAALRYGSKCSRTNVYAPLLNRIDALPSNTIWGFITNFIYPFYFLRLMKVLDIVFDTGDLKYRTLRLNIESTLVVHLSIIKSGMKSRFRAAGRSNLIWCFQTNFGFISTLPPTCEYTGFHIWYIKSIASTKRSKNQIVGWKNWFFVVDRFNLMCYRCT